MSAVLILAVAVAVEFALIVFLYRRMRLWQGRHKVEFLMRRRTELRLVQGPLDKRPATG